MQKKKKKKKEKEKEKDFKKLYIKIKNHSQTYPK